MLHLPKCVYYTNQQGITLAADLVQDRDQQFSDDLISSGTNLAGVAYGLGLGDHYALLKNLLKQNPKLARYGVMGLARGQHHEHANELAGDDKTLKHARVEGYAQAGADKQVNAALSSSASYLLPTIRGLAANGQNIPRLIQVLRGTKHFLSAILVAAECGHVDVVAKLCEHLKIDLNKLPEQVVMIPGLSSDSSPLTTQHLFNSLLHAYAKGRHYHQAAHLITLGVNINFCVSGFEEGMDSNPDYSMDDDINLLLKQCPASERASIVAKFEKAGEFVEVDPDMPDLPALHELKQRVLTANHSK